MDNTYDRYIRIRSADSGTVYTLVIFKDGSIACNCGDFVHRRRLGRDECKHIARWKSDNIPAGAARTGRVVDEPSLFH